MINLNTDMVIEQFLVTSPKTHINDIKAEILNDNLELWITYKLEISEKYFNVEVF